MNESSPGGQTTGKIQRKMEAIIDQMRELGSMVVAFSGGVDSSVVAALAVRAVGQKVRAVTAVSETLAGPVTQSSASSPDALSQADSEVHGISAQLDRRRLHPGGFS